ncbi:Polysaccharide deacetylase [Planctomycetes bacterium Poly30]|uniref:Polysaccharide deacetylase n=1 Tax=Saltatorellus ferox TaxID=2528018 RepID=A0A518ERX1_9BACT|nr:Polysaccharide deacetylase [Planctomycetes bacterium Poly30]
MSIKHRLKGAAREVFARIIWHTGLHRAFDAMGEPRMLILYGHCVDQPATNAALGADMKITAGRLESILRALGRRYDMVTVGEGATRLSDGATRSMVALTMDDGYRDNLHDLVPLLQRTGARCTVFLEGGAVAERRLPWLHALGWLQAKLGVAELGHKLAERLPDHADALRAVEGSENRQKRILKYDVDPAARARALDELVLESGGHPREIVDALYLSEDEARALHAAAPIEIGGHTVNHPVLSCLAEADQLAEIAGGRAALEELLGEPGAGGVTFAYPYGRRWDFDDASARSVQAAGYRQAVTTHSGVNRAGTDPYRLRRWPIHDRTRLHLVGTEACGAFDWLRRLGIDLVE